MKASRNLFMITSLVLMAVAGIIWHPLSVNGVVEGEVFAMSGLEAFSIA